MILWYDMIWYHLNGWIGPREFPFLQTRGFASARSLRTCTTAWKTKPGSPLWPLRNRRKRCWRRAKQPGAPDLREQRSQKMGLLPQRWPLWGNEIVIGWISGLFHAIGPKPDISVGWWCASLPFLDEITAAFQVRQLLARVHELEATWWSLQKSWWI